MSPVKYGPPHHIKYKPYNVMLEILETNANRKLIDEYFGDVSKTLANLESASSVNSAMIDLQPEIQWFMRPFLLDFLIELHSSFKLQPSTLFLCLNIIDRYCAKRIVFKRHYQLVGCTALWIAGKYEDKKSRVPTLKELTVMCRNAYDEEMFVQMEMHILSTLEWSLAHPNLEDCLQLAIHHSKISQKSDSTPCKYNSVGNSSTSTSNSSVSAVTAVGRFLCELSMYDKCFMNLPTSLVSITANLLACNMLQLPHASNSLKQLMNKLKRKSSNQTLYANSNQSNFSHNTIKDTMILNNQDPENLPIVDDDMDSDYFSEDIDECNDDNDNYDNSDSFQQELENIQPDVWGAFLSGFDDCALQNIKKITLYFIVHLTKVTEVLTKKYEQLGVIQVINNFHSRFNHVIQSIHDKQSNILLDSIDDQLYESAEVLLNFPKFDVCNNSPFYSLDKSPMVIRQNNITVPVTPPSATSQYSVFSNKRSSANTTPTYSSSIYNSGSSILRTKSKISKHRGGHSSTTTFLDYSPCDSNNPSLTAINKASMSTNHSTCSVYDTQEWSSPLCN
jgi:hypothetical protein